MSNHWLPNEKTKVAEAAGLNLRELTDFLAGRRNFSVEKARELEAASITVMGLNRKIPAAAWLRLEKHPATKMVQNRAAVVE